MNEVLILVGILAVLFLVLKCIEIIDRRIRIVDEKSKFIADLYRLQRKYTKRGRYDFAKALGMIIEAFNLPEPDNKAKTDYGRRIINDLKKLNDEEV